MTIAIMPFGPPVEIDLDDFVPWVRELVRWLGPGEWQPTLAGLICGAPSGLMDDLRSELEQETPVAWSLNSIVRLALLPLAELSLVDGQPVIPELGATLLTVLTDPRLGADERDAVEVVLLDSEELEGQLVAESRGV